MNYVVTFLEGVISFISPCMLPMLPLYISYFAAGEEKKSKVFARAAAFVGGFTLVFCLLGLFAGTLGTLLRRYQVVVDIVCGLIVILFGLSYLEVIRLPFFKGMQSGHKISGILSAFLFGVIYSVSLTPCVGAFLGSALMLASASATAWRGVLLLFCYSLGMGSLCLLSAVLIDRLKGTFRFIKEHYRVINLVCGIFLIVVGVLMACGLMTTVIGKLM
jgi:cytochrome c-type biogenesis protein